VIALVQRGIWALLSWFRRSDRLWTLVDRTGIVVFVGPNGSGKSLAAVHSALRTLRGIRWECDQLAHHHAEPLARHIDACAEGCDRDTQRPVYLCPVGQDLWDVPGIVYGERLVYSTVPLLDDSGEPHDLYRPLVDFRQLVTVEHSDVLFDEVAGVSDAADSSAVPVQVTNWLHQLRKRDVRLRVTTPAYGRCSKPIRQVAQVVVDARSFFAESVESGRLWRPRRAMLFRAFDAFSFDDYTAGVAKGDRVKPMAGAAFWRPGSEASQRYDTLGAVTALGHVTEGGMCAVCGGSRSRPKCACDHAVDDLPVDRLRVEETVSAGGARTRRAVVLEVEGAGRSEAEAERSGARNHELDLPTTVLPVVDQVDDQVLVDQVLDDVAVPAGPTPLRLALYANRHARGN
jgi:hypothetical protein